MNYFFKNYNFEFYLDQDRTCKSCIMIGFLQRPNLWQLLEYVKLYTFFRKDISFYIFANLR